MLTIGEQKKTIPIDSELTHAAEQKKHILEDHMI